MMQDPGALKKYPAFQDKLDTILNNTRASEAKAASVQNFQRTHEAYKRQNEATLTANLLPLLIKLRRSVNREPATCTPPPDASDCLSHESVIEESKREKYTNDRADVAFLEDGILTFADKDFTRSLVPWKRDASSSASILIKAMAKIQGMTNPRPDYIYGFSPGKLELPIDYSQESDIPALLDLVNGMVFPFLFIEAKSDTGSHAEGENQACRAGSTIVDVHRALLAKTSPIDAVKKTGPDEETFVFSCVMGPLSMDIYVHWAEVLPSGEVLYQMNLVSTDDFRWPVSVTALRQKLHNILDWGFEIRLSALRVQQPKLIGAYDREVLNSREQRRSQSQSPRKRSRLVPPSATSGMTLDEL